MLMFFSFWTKCYVQGMCMKRLDSIIKQITMLIATVCMFPFSTLHNCEFSYSVKDYDTQDPKPEDYPHAKYQKEQWSKMSRANGFFCISDFKENTIVVWIALGLVFSASVAYLFAIRDKQRKTMYKKKAEEAADKLP